MFGKIFLGYALSRFCRVLGTLLTNGVPLLRALKISSESMAMSTVAEQSNSLDHVLVDIADTIDRQNSRQIDTMLRLVEPLMLLVMGGLIMFIIAALLLPVFDMSAALGTQ